MPYVSASDIAVTLPAHVTITGSSVPLTLDEVATIIAEVSGEIDGAAAAAGYTVPISSTATVAYAAMQRAVKQGVGAQVLMTIFPALGGPGDTSSLAVRLAKSYDDTLKALRGGKYDLVGAGSSAGEDGRALPRARSTSQTVASPIIDMAWQP